MLIKEFFWAPLFTWVLQRITFPWTIHYTFDWFCTYFWSLNYFSLVQIGVFYADNNNFQCNPSDYFLDSGSLGEYRKVVYLCIWFLLPSSLGNSQTLCRCNWVEDLQLQNNQFSGNLPKLVPTTSLLGKI